mmetsp:Transcript_32367/g.75138  ORF Transcript_32367/g.75138 Transcript_32367/m.75138 type:complete len:208 (+) Transcript_32367:54-677(+)
MEAAQTRVLQQLSVCDFTKLVDSCEELELAIQEEVFDAPAAEQLDNIGALYAIHLLAYLLEGRLNAARFLWKRTPAAVQQQPQPLAAHEALAALWQRKHAEFFRHLRAGPWDARLQVLAAEVASRGRHQLLNEIGDAYEVITVERLAAILGVDIAEAQEACAERNWGVDATGHASPIPVKTSKDLMQMGEAQLKKLAKYVAYLEQPQ